MAAVEWAPTVDNVGALLRARTIDPNGRQLGTFTPDTRPTERQVLNMIDGVTDDLADTVLGANPDAVIPERLYGSARRVAVYAAACEIELGYFPEQVASGRSPYPQLKELLDERRAALLRALEDAGVDTDAPSGTAASDGSASPGVPPPPTGSFPLATVRYLDEGVVRAPGAEWPWPYAAPSAW